MKGLQEILEDLQIRYEYLIEVKEELEEDGNSIMVQIYSGKADEVLRLMGIVERKGDSIGY